MSKNLTALYFGFYNPDYARNAVLINGLRAGDVKVIECNVKSRSFFGWIRLALGCLRQGGKYDVMVVGFPGQEAMFLARLLTRKPIIFDAFTSHYGGYILDRKYYPERSWRARYYKFLDKYSCKLADVILLDTQAHINFFVKEFGLPPEKFRRIWVGAPDVFFHPARVAQREGQPFTIVFFGTFIPLQGTEHIIKAAKILENENITFRLIGDGQEKPKVVSLVRELGLKNVVFAGMIATEELRNEIEGADICLGIFGNTLKASLVIPNKVYDALAMRRPVITADTPAMRELFDENDLFLIKAADPDSLADGIRKLKDNPSLRESLARNGFSKFAQFASPDILGQELVKIINELVSADAKYQTWLSPGRDKFK